MHLIFNLQKGEFYSLTLELRDPNVNAIEFVLKDGTRDRWLVYLFLLVLKHLVHTTAQYACLKHYEHFFLMVFRLKLNHGNFRLEIPESSAPPLHTPVPKDLIEQKAYQLSQSKGGPSSSPQQQKVGTLPIC